MKVGSAAYEKEAAGLEDKIQPGSFPTRPYTLKLERQRRSINEQKQRI